MDYIDALDILDKTFVGNLEAKVMNIKSNTTFL